MKPLSPNEFCRSQGHHQGTWKGLHRARGFHSHPQQLNFHGLGFRVEGFGFRVSGLGPVWGLGLRV